ncbi:MULTISPECIES: SpvB/TcaC N-terminal domain-containing protein [Sulfurimonadaceae]|uniref:SpvB/TcaC N-terminal domain-containing protein n=1 Tax=Sulfurimonadaceae TaxID=2771471 RepID=UPI0024C1AEE6|nr:SpvB/TcaC N-terminal domain-containing protein [Sulfurimonas sp. HSL-3221]
MFHFMRKLSTVISPVLASVFLFSSTIGTAQASVRSVTAPFLLGAQQNSHKESDPSLLMFDGNNHSVFSPEKAVLVERDFNAPVLLKGLKLLGGTDYEISVDYFINGVWEQCQAWSGLKQPSSQWHTYSVAEPIAAEKIRISMVPSKKNGRGVGEIQFLSDQKIENSSSRVFDDTGIKDGYRNVYPMQKSVKQEYGSTTFALTTALHAGQIARAWLEYDVEGVSGGASVIRAINDELALGGLLIQATSTNGAKKKVHVREEINPESLHAGFNRVKFINHERGEIPEPYSVSNAVLSLSTAKKLEQTAGARLAVFTPQKGLSYKEYAYIRGFVQANGQNIKKVTVDGKAVPVNGGAFESLVKVKGTKEVVVHAVMENGTTLNEKVAVNTTLALMQAKSVQLSESGVALLSGKQPVLQTRSVLARAGKTTRITLGEATLEVQKQALKANRQIKVSTLGERDLPPLDPGMVNVTKDQQGYRFLPHGTKFDKENRLELAYDESKLPKGSSAKDVKTYFFDEETGRWLPLPKVAAASGVVASTTTHFTDMINAVIKTPDAPQAKAYGATQIKDLKVANPGAKINLIQPPKASTQGDAQLSYPLEIPGGRHGMMPQLNVNYSSGSSNSWMGLGWNLSTPSVGIDTRWGVPHYYDDNESETYMLGGQQLAPQAHRSAPVSRTSEKRFYPRVEGTFNKVVRHGSDPKHYWWEVTSKNGAKSFYGGKPSSGVDHAAVLTDSFGNIGHWALVQSIDVYGNTVNYTYEKVRDSGMGDGKGGVDGFELYVKKINYTGFNGDDGAYDVVFIRDRDLQEPRRDDITISARLGFKRVTADLLRKVEIRFQETTFRTYSFEYTKGAFEKTLLKKIEQYDAEGSLFNTHTFNYFDDVRKDGKYAPFEKEKKQWSVDPVAYDAVPSNETTVPAAPLVTTSTSGSATTTPMATPSSVVSTSSTETSIKGLMEALSHVNEHSRLNLDLEGIVSKGNALAEGLSSKSGFEHVQVSVQGVDDEAIAETARDGVADLIYSSGDDTALDYIRVWQAPFAGTVAIDAPLALVSVGTNDQADGVRVSVQHQDREVWNTVIAPDDFNVKYPEGTDAIIVQKDDLILFRVHGLSNGFNDVVSWSPAVSYLDKPVGTFDANNLPLYDYSYTKEFLPLAAAADLPYSGTIIVQGEILKESLSDDVNLSLVKYSAASDQSSVLWSYASKAQNKLQEEPEYGEFDVEAGDKVFAVVSTQSPIDAKAIVWKPVVTYKSMKKRFIDRVILGDVDLPALATEIRPAFTLYRPLKESTAWSVPSDGTMLFDAAVPGTWDGAEPLNFTVKSGGELLAKQQITMQTLMTGAYKPLSVDVTQGQDVYVDYSSLGTVSGVETTYWHPDATLNGKTVEFDAAGLSELPLNYEVFYRGWGEYVFMAADGDNISPVKVADLMGAVSDPTRTLQSANAATDSNSTAATDEGASTASVTAPALRSAIVNGQKVYVIQSAPEVKSSSVISQIGFLSALSGSISKTKTLSASATVGPVGDTNSKTFTVGGKAGSSWTEDNGVLAFVDIDGDSLPDQVFDDGDHLKYKKNLSHSGIERFGVAKLIYGVGAFHHSKSNSSNRGAEAHYYAFAGVNKSKTTTTTDIYFSDVNGDGLIDVVKKGVVYYNHIDSEGKPIFTLNSADTPNPIAQSGSVNSEGWIPEQTAEERAQLDSENPLHDTVKVWEAPEAGVVSIYAPVNLIQDTSEERPDYLKADGVMVSIEHREVTLWSEKIASDDYATKTPTGVSSVAVQQGDRIYFRVDSINDGMYDKVSWAPIISYTDKTDRLDANNLPVYQYDAKEDFLLSGYDVTMPIEGTVSIQSTFSKTVTSDDVILRFVKVDSQNGDTVLWEENMGRGAEQNATVVLPNRDVLKEEKYRFEVVSDTNVDWSKVVWTPTVVYVASPENITLFDENNVALLKLHATPTVQTFSTEYVASIPWVPDANMSSAKIKPLLVLGAYDNGRAVFSIKRNAELLGKQVVEYQDGSLVTPLQSYNVDLTDKHGIYFEYHTNDRDFATFLGQNDASVSIKIDNNITLYHEAGVHARRAFSIFGPMYRHWGQFVYNANDGRSTMPIMESLLGFSGINGGGAGAGAFDNANSKDDLQNAFDTYGYDPATSMFIIMFARSEADLWQGVDTDTQLGRTTISASRLGLKSIEQDNPIAVDGENGVPVRGISKVMKSEAQGYSAGFLLGVSVSDQTNKTLTDFIDMNGDRYPDIVGNDRLQYTTRYGSLDSNISSGIIGGFPTYGEAHSETLSAGTFAFAELVTSGSSNAYAADSNDPSAGLSGYAGSCDDQGEYSYRDINGDGLPDRVDKNGNVRLNLGYRFTDVAEEWGYGEIQTGESESLGAGASINLVNYSISAGLSINTSDNKHKHTLSDLNGDGLIDEVYINGAGSVMARINTGNGYTDTIEWSGAGGLYESETLSGDANGYITACVNIPLPPIRFCVNPGGSVGEGGSRDKAMLSDIDGDGYPDYLSSSDSNNLAVKRSTIGRTNLLKSVERPLGAVINLDYKRSGNTYQNPHSKWVLDTVEVFDGHSGDGADTMKKRLYYKDGYYDRHEREFYGFAWVTAVDLDTANSDSVYRKTVSHYINGNYYEKGLLDYSKVIDDANRTYVENFNSYNTVDIFTQQTMSDEEKDEDGRVTFPQLQRQQTLYYEGTAQAGQRMVLEYTYDRYGNIRTQTDYGEMSDPSDDYKAYVTYYQDLDAYILSVPQTIHIYDAGNNLLRHREATVNERGAVTQVRVNSGAAPLNTDMTYDAYGNLESITNPPNHKGQRYAVHYVMDDVVNTYTTVMHDSFGYTATAAYDYRFGVQTNQTDINNQPVVTTLDAKGRVETITGPLEAGTGDTTITHHYYPEEETPYAVTEHYDEGRPDTIDTVTFIDGLMRVVQTKKDAAIDEDKDGVALDGMVVSGHIVFDSFGRTVAVYYPVSEMPASKETFNTDIDNIAPTRTHYDILDRKTLTTLPDGATLANAYDFGADRQGVMRFHTLRIDANGNEAENFKDVRNRITSVLQHNPLAEQEDIWTSYSYNAVNELISVLDDKENLTQAVYDLAGRRTDISNPDTGLIKSVYDAAGNVIEKITPNLRATGKSISYEYDYNRLSHIAYPENPQNNATYTYGDDASNYNVGRVISITDGSGIRRFEYGKLGETTKETRTLFTFTGTEPKTYITGYRYDTWNRLRELTYPDGEVLTHTYDRGGKLSAMEGRKGSHKYDYLKTLTYDKFGQRVFVRYANDTTMTYAYEPERRRLANIVAANDQRTFMDDVYAYDAMQNILGINNRAGVPVDSPYFGGETQQNFSYDNLYQLTGANGDWVTRQGHEHRYDLKMVYDTIGNIQSKNQLHERLPYEGDKWIEQKGTSYNWIYSYTGMQPHAASRIGERKFTYDANGNQIGWENLKNHTNRVIKWDEENRIASVSDNGETSYYVYDADGERTLKRTSQGETFYVNPYYVIREGEVSSKHFFVGSQRIATKLAKKESDNNGKGNSQPILEKEQYYYHLDHLGSSSFISDRNGKVFEHLEYFPSGETFGHEHSNTQRTPYRFTGKEYDEMTGLYYFGARYYDPRTSVWQNPDQILSRYMNGQGNDGVYNPRNLNLFTYSYNNPIVLSDPDGNIPIDTVWDIASVVWDVGKIGVGYATGNQKLVGEGVVDLAADSVAVLIPYVPAGATKLARKGGDAVQAAKKVNYSRPSNYRKGVRDKVWDNATDSKTGRVRDPKTGQFMSKEKSWDMGHKPGYEFRKHQKSAEERGISREKFLDEHNNPEHYRPELPQSNRSHAGEDKTDTYFGN